MNDAEEQAYIRGAVQALRRTLAGVLMELRGYGEDVSAEHAIQLLSETKAALHRLAGELGCDVPDLHPVDLVARIEKEVL